MSAAQRKPPREPIDRVPRESPPCPRAPTALGRAPNGRSSSGAELTTRGTSGNPAVVTGADKAGAAVSAPPGAPSLWLAGIPDAGWPPHPEADPARIPTAPGRAEAPPLRRPCVDSNRDRVGNRPPARAPSPLRSTPAHSAGSVRNRTHDGIRAIHNSSIVPPSPSPSHSSPGQIPSLEPISAYVVTPGDCATAPA